MIQLSFLTMISPDDQFLTGFIKTPKVKKPPEMSSISQQIKTKKSLNLSCKPLTYLLILAYLFMKKIPKLINQPYLRENKLKNKINKNFFNNVHSILKSTTSLKS